jgi:glucose-6-phosphate isomerase
LLGLIGVWHSSFCNYTNLAIIPYESRLEFFPRYIQQLQMESNGKNSSRYSETVSGLMSPVVWGDIGTNSQHSFFQYLHQGTHTVPIEFIVGRSSSVGLDEEHHDLLKLNCVAQSEALMSGNSDNEESSPMSIEGNKPSITLIYDKLDPFTLGALVALYEHKVFVEGILLGINSFDQFGVELGKSLAKKYMSDLYSNSLFSRKNSNLSKDLLRQLFKDKNG